MVLAGVMPAAPCRVLSASWSQIVCQTEPSGHMHPGAIPGRVSPVEISVNGIYAQCKVPSKGIWVRYAADVVALPECAAKCDSSALYIAAGSFSADGAYGGMYGGTYGGTYRGTYGGNNKSEEAHVLPMSGAYGGTYGGIGSAEKNFGAYGDAFGGVHGNTAIKSDTSLTWIMARCCNTMTEDYEEFELGEEWGLDTEPLAFMGNAQEPGVQDACTFWYSAYQTPTIKNFTQVLTAGDSLLIEGPGLGHDSMQVFLAPVDSAVGVQRWDNIYQEDGDPPPPVILPSLEGNPEIYELAVFDRAHGFISAIVPDDLAAGQYMPIVHSSQVGAASYSESDPILTILPTISTASPASLPSSGGFVTISGAGFPVDSSRVVLEGYGAQWHVVTSTTTSITAYATNINQWGAQFTTHIKDLAQHSVECIHDACHLSVTKSVVWVDAYEQISAGSDVTLTLSHNSDTDPDFWAGISDDGAVYVLLDNGVKVFPTITVNDSTAQLLVPTKSLPASPGSGHSSVLVVEGYGIADRGAGLAIQVPVTISAVNASSGALQLLILIVVIE